MSSVVVDETEPLLNTASDLARVRSNQQVVHDPRKPSRIIDFDPNGDPENPQEWPRPFKWAITLILVFMAFSVTFNCVSVVPIANRIVDDLSDGQSSKYASVLLVTIWELGEAAGPVFIAPLSELFGRYPVLNVCNLLFTGTTIFAALSPSTPLFILARALSGLVVSSNVLSPAIIGDIFEPDRRGSPMSLAILAPLIGGGIGPAIAGAIAESLGWRWVLYIATILIGTGGVLTLVFFRETYKVAILNRRASRLRDSLSPANSYSYSTISSADTHVDPEDGIAEETSKRGDLLESIIRPFYVFGSSGVLMSISLFGSLGFAHFYNVSTTLPDILQTTYGLSPKATGASLICFSVGSAVSVFICNSFLDRIYIRLRATHDGIGQPEFRLPLAIIGAFTIPFAVALYGWVAHLHLPLPLLLFSIGFVGCTLILATLPLSAYVVDAFGLYSASAMTGFIVARCLMGTFLPLATTPLVEAFGYGWGFTVLGLVNLSVAPIPLVVMKYGAHWRYKSKYTRHA
jgi:MFS family permease